MDFQEEIIIISTNAFSAISNIASHYLPYVHIITHTRIPSQWKKERAMQIRDLEFGMCSIYRALHLVVNEISRSYNELSISELCAKRDFVFVYSVMNLS